MNLAGKHGLLLEKIVQSHPEFHGIKFEASYAHNGSLCVLGWVESEKELSDLKSIVTNSKPPVFVYYNCEVDASGTK
jgi:hypothetical protein